MLSGMGVIGGNTGPGFTILNADGSPASSLLPGVSVIGGTAPLGLTITPGAGSAASGLGSSLGEIGGHPSPYPAFTFSPGPAPEAGSVDLRGIEFVDALPSMPAARGFVPSSGDLANQMAININNSRINQLNFDTIRYNGYAAGQNIIGNTPVERHNYNG
jgi:hypothetical protein